MFKLNYRFSRMARIVILLGLWLLVVAATTSVLNNYYLTNVITQYATQVAQYEQYIYALRQECIGTEGFDGESSWDRYQDHYADDMLPYQREQFTGESETHRM